MKVYQVTLYGPEDDYNIVKKAEFTRVVRAMQFAAKHLSKAPRCEAIISRLS